MKKLLYKYKHAWVLLYAFIYFPWFFYLEKHVTRGFHVIHTAIDEKIPFIEYFIIPYLLWFVFMIVAATYFFFTDKQDFYRLAAFMIIGMTIFLIFSSLYPNGQILRPKTFARDNIFVDLVKQLYKTDTPTNIFPSIHVYNSIAVYLAVRKSRHLEKNKPVQIATLVLTAMIILSTMFLKQHSVLDVIGAFLLSAFVYRFVYVSYPKRAHSYRTSLKKLPN